MSCPWCAGPVLPKTRGHDRRFCSAACQTRAYNRKYHAANKEVLNAKKREYRAVNKEKISAYNRKYRAANKEMSRERYIYTLERILWRGARLRAKKAGLEFDITEFDIYIPERCPVLGTPLVPGVGKPHANSPTVDRIDNSRGYVRGNIAVISYRANEMKSAYSLDEIEALAQYMRTPPAWIEEVA
jgi:endogenous inhibitor of DNA gyrase (YacG/DUF329 family)